MQQFLQFIILTFIYSSSRFGRPHAHHQELNNCSSSLWFYLRIMMNSSAVVRGRVGRPNHEQQHCYHQAPTVNQRLLLQLFSS